MCISVSGNNCLGAAVYLKILEMSGCCVKEDSPIFYVGKISTFCHNLWGSFLELHCDISWLTHTCGIMCRWQEVSGNFAVLEEC